MPDSEANTPPPYTIFLPLPSAILDMLNSSSTASASATIINFAAEEGPNQPNKDGPLPASKKSIADMPLVKITPTQQGMALDAEKPSSCAICLGEYEGEVAKEMPCKHRYHPDCIDKWLGVRGTCPVCRYQMPLEEDQEDKGSQEELGEIFMISIWRLIRNYSEGGATEDDHMENID